MPARASETRTERDFLEVAKKRVTRPKEASGKRRILVYGRTKKGKTTFGLSAGVEKTLVIDPEHGTDAFLKLNPYVWHVDKWEDVQDVAGAARTGKLSPKLLDLGPSDEPFDWLLVDGMTRLNNMALRYIMGLAEQTSLTRKPGLVQRQDYGKSGELMKEMMLKFQAMPMNVCYTAHERTMTQASDDAEDEDVEGSETQYFVADLPAGVRSVLTGVAEVVGRIYTQRVTMKDDRTIVQRRLWIGPHEKYDTGFRSDFNPPEMLKRPTLPKLVEAMTGQAA